MKFVTYENENEVFHGDMEQLREWFRVRDPREYPLDDLTIYSCDAPDVYELAKEMRPDG
jgi:hypothetical protein